MSGPSILRRGLLVSFCALLAIGSVVVLLHEKQREWSALSQVQDQLRKSAESAAALQTRLSEVEADARRVAAESAEREKITQQREAALAGREDAATERTQSSFQGLMIQQQLIKTLEALKASLPDLTPEMDRLTKEHAQLSAERDRLLRENAELRQRAGSPPAKRPLPNADLQ